ncbi:unnamed protein product [Malassezia sympodialis ATCC 42132]|uniref:uncharacterized protein n=1 Tax=Malassezia sympodialis (strain ATCC 42132) TaxID=1230383 RepID=UPI0002C1E75D|nr:uncharacterized protein MSY001_2466 [Malassezia sympodialis ATCC 42132]CCU99760.1 unnamed protein product [Malassezia sympodialis ATCC 42132]|eukprot:XP_018740992.1 uncharacterized protein MSY001_2466 [Malassezia sympodialis ATCC 42132]
MQDAGEASTPMADPFPSLGEPARREARPDVSSEDAFPTLGASSARGMRAAPTAWVSPVPVIQRVVHQATVSLRLSDEQLAKLNTVLPRVQAKCPTVKLEASTTRKTGYTTFIFKGANEAAVQLAKKELTVQLARRVTGTVLVPASLRAHVIGAGGKNIKRITEQTGVRIHVPPRSGDAAAEEADDPLLGEQMEITIEGDEVHVQEAQALIQAIVAERTSKLSQSLAHIEPEYYPFLAGVRGARVEALAANEGRGEVTIKVPPPHHRHAPILVHGERASVGAVVDAIESQVRDMRASFHTLSLTIPKRQHVCLVGDGAADILAATQCSVELPPVHDASESVTIRGPQAQLPLALTAALERANAITVKVVDVGALHAGADAQHARYLVQWLGGRAPRAEGVQVFMPTATALDAGRAHVDVVGKDAEAVARVHRELEELVRPLDPSALRVADLDPLAHDLVAGKRGQNLKAYEARGVDVLVPPEHSGRSDVLLVHRGAAAERAAVLEAVLQELAAAAAPAADLQTAHVSIPAKHHAALLDRTVLNALMGEDRIQVTAGRHGPVPAGVDARTNDSVVVRGAPAAVERVVARLQQMAADAEQDSMESSFVDELRVPGAYVPRLIGRGGAAVAKLRDELGVRVDFPDADDKARAKQVPIVLTGRKACVTEAKARLAAQVQRLADETTVRLRVPSEMHGALIGPGGKYVSRLQDKYGVRIVFPRGDEAQAGDEVSVRGGKRGVAEAQAELLELLAYEQERSQAEELAVPQRAVARILGRSGATINQLRLESGAEIDVEREAGAGEQAVLRLRGSRAAIEAARAAILDLVAAVEREAELQLDIPSRFHAQLIGQGGQHLRDLIVRAGGPSEPRAQAQMVRFARDRSDAVTVRAEQGVAQRIAELLQSEARALAERVVHGAVVPPRLHGQLVARGGRRNSPWQQEHGVQIVLPNWREYAELEAPANATDLVDADPAHIVKVLGGRESVPQVLQAIDALVAADAQRRRPRAPRAARVDDADDDE